MFTNYLSFLLALSLLAVNTACFRHSFRGAPGEPEPGTKPTTSRWQHNFVFSLVKASDDVDLTVCKNGVWQTYNQIGVHHALISALTFHIYNPTRVKLYCIPDEAEAEAGEASVGAPDASTDQPS